MNKLLKVKWIAAIYGEQFEWTTRIFRFLLQQTMLSTLFTAIYFGIAGKPLVIAFSAAGFVLSTLLFYLTFKLQELKNVYLIVMFVINVFLMPAGFLVGGGYNGLLPVWMLLFFVLTFLLLRGWRMYLVFTGTLLADITVFLLNLLRPELFREVELGRSSQILSMCGSLIFIGSILGIVLEYQIDKLAGERQIAEERGKELEEISKSKSLFFANMSHEIRTPINTIIGLNEMTLRENVSDEVAENAINIQNASKLLLALINDILDLSKVESGKMEIVPAQYETASMFSDLVNIIWVRANQKGLDFKIDIAEDIPSMLCGDEVRIKQVLTNILTNAVKYTETGSVTLTVAGEHIGDNQLRLKIAVEDTGIGIRKESLEELFTVFKRVDQQKTRMIEGTGLGLALSKQLVDMMGGSIKVDSIYQKGSCFTVTLDQQIIDESPIGSLQYAAKRKAADRKRYDRSFEAPDARVLVVDDNEMNRLVAKKLLRDTKVQVELAASGRECLEKTKETMYHVILMDHMMPEMDGEETLKLLRSRQDGFCQTTPVIALTANVMDNANQWYQERGFDGYLAKPISGVLLESLLLKFLPQELLEYTQKEIGNTETPEYSAMVFHKKKKRIAVCAECVCDLPAEWVAKYDIRLMYYYVLTEDGRFIDTQEIGSGELMEYMAQGKSAKSSAAPLAEYESFLADRLVEAEQVLLLTIASQLNNHGFTNAKQAAENFDNVTVYNTGHLSSGMGLMVLAAAKMASDGASMEEILAELDRLKEKVSTSFILGTVDNMYQNERIGKRIWQICKHLQLHPILCVRQNHFTIGGFEIGDSDRIAKNYIRKQLRRSRRIDRQLLFVTYVGLNVRQLEEIRKEIEKRAKFDIIRFQKASATISSNSGMGTFGLLYIRK